MPPIPAARKKLKEATFFYGKLHETHRSLGQGGEPSEFEYFLSAFLSAGRSVLLIHEHVDGNWNYFNGWRANLLATGRDADAALLDLFGGQRNKEIHRHGAELAITTEWVPFTQLEHTDRTHPGYGFHWFGPPGTPPPQVGRLAYVFQGGTDDVLKQAERYLALLEEFATAYEAAHP
jgi:hypothetical protein